MLKLYLSMMGASHHGRRRRLRHRRVLGTQASRHLYLSMMVPKRRRPCLRHRRRRVQGTQSDKEHVGTSAPSKVL
jgi:hypothetical protein